MQLKLSTWMEIDAYLERSKAILIPIGSTEQHGPTGLIGTDFLCPEIVGERVAADGDILMAPTFNVGMAQHHLGFSGSMTLRPSTFMAVMEDWVTSLTVHGFTHFYFLNGHGGNIATINAGFAEIYAKRSLQTAEGRPRIRMKLRNWWDGKETMDFCKATYGDAHGSHATPSEVAITQYGYPDHIKKSNGLDPEIAPNGGFTDAVDYRRRFPDGRIGSNPLLANPKDGGKIVEISAREIIEDFQKFEAEEI